ncbi:MAG TPA: hypothetical protein PJ991_09335, partial [Kiritimatiellia bacterium]|nr:hypothetical protein [Kiritimatiellia bacterium]
MTCLPWRNGGSYDNVWQLTSEDTNPDRVLLSLNTGADASIHVETGILTFGVDGETIVINAALLIGEAASDECYDSISIDIVKLDPIEMDGKSYPLPPGRSATASTKIAPEGRNLQWDIYNTKSDKDQPPVIAHISGDGESVSIIADENSGTGWVYFRVYDDECDECIQKAKLYIGCSSCGTSCDRIPGGGFVNLSSIDIRMTLGQAVNGGAAGDLTISAEAPAPNIATPSSLEFSSLAPGVKTIVDDEDNIRQILTAQTLVDVVTIDNVEYEVRFYSPEAILGVDSEGLYIIDTVAQPFTVWRIKNPDSSGVTYNQLAVTKIIGNLTTEYLYAYDDSLSTWSLDRDGLQVEKRVSSIDAQTGNRIETHILENSLGLVAEKTETEYHAFSWGESPIRIVSDPDGDALTSTTEYYSDPMNPGSEGKVKKVIDSSGSWTRYEYDNDGRITHTVRGWLDAGENAANELARYTEYTYEAVDSQDSELPGDARKPRVVTEYIEDIPVSRTYHVYMEDEGGRIEIVERCDTSSAAYGASGNLRTITAYHPFMRGALTSEKVKSVQFKDGRKDVYTYSLGTLDAGQTPPVFTPDVEGTYRQTTVTHEGPSGPVTHKSTRDVSIEDEFGNVVLRETHVYDGSDWDNISWTVNNHDEFGRLLSSLRSNGELTEESWNCCGKESETDAAGKTILYSHDALNRIDMMTRVGISGGSWPDQENVIVTYTYDGAGRQITETTSSGGLSLTTSNQYDLAGRLIKSRNHASIITEYEYEQDGLLTRTIHPGGAVEETLTYLDGQMKSVTGSAVVEKHYEYGVNADGTKWTMVYTGPGGSDSEMWERSTTDALGRTIKVERPAFGGGALTNAFFYDNVGRLSKQDPGNGAAATLFEYDEMGNMIRSGRDVDGNNLLTLASMDRISDNETAFLQSGGDWWRRSVSKVYPNNDGATPVTVSETLERLTGFTTPGMVREMITKDVLGNITASRTFIDREAATVETAVDYPDSDTDQVNIEVNGRMVFSKTRTGVETTYAYDDLGRQVEVTDPRTGTSLIHYNALGQVDYIEDAMQNRTSFGYDSLSGHRISVTNALSDTISTDYDEQGRMIRQSGATYPVEYDYDEFGRMVVMRTWRDESGTPDATYWNYDPATGLLTNKVFADGKATTYTYTSDGKLATRVWARGVTTTYSYDTATETLTGLTYSDTTPDVTFTYDRIGRQITVEDALGTRTNVYNASTLLHLAEQLPNGIELERTYDSLGRPAGIAVSGGPGNYSVTYGYDNLGRFSYITSSVESVQSVISYSYLPESDLIEGWTYSAGASFARTYESHRNLINGIENMSGTNLISAFAYTNDEVGRRIQRIDTRPSMLFSNTFEYNARSEVISALMGDDDHEYVYDAIGNRERSRVNAATNTYTANELNQYISVTNATGIEAAYDNDGNLVEFGDWSFTWDGENRLVKVASNQLPVVENLYDYQGRRVMKITPTSTSSYLYDGWNVIRETRAEYTPMEVANPSFSSGLSGWETTNATAITCFGAPAALLENIGSSISQEVGVVSGEQYVVTFNYHPWACSDVGPGYSWYFHRLTVGLGDAVDTVGGYYWPASWGMASNFSLSFIPTSAGSLRFMLTNGLYNATVTGIQVLHLEQRQIYQVWGLDLSQNLQGAGGVGGLVLTVQDDQMYVPSYDANGNVTEYVDSNDVVVAHYKYDPFGNITVQTGDMADRFPYRFSTKYTDDETKLVYYGYR